MYVSGYFVINFSVPTAPRSLTVVNVTDTTVTLSWLPPDPSNGFIRRYRVQYRIISSLSYTTLSPPTTDLTYTITGLNISAKFWFRVRAVTTAGGGPFSVIKQSTCK